MIIPNVNSIAIDGTLYQGKLLAIYIRQGSGSYVIKKKCCTWIGYGYAPENLRVKSLRQAIRVAKSLLKNKPFKIIKQLHYWQFIPKDDKTFFEINVQTKG